MFLIDKLSKIKKRIIKWYKKYFTVEGLYNCILPDKMYIKKLYKFRTGKKLNLKNPQTFNEKQNWLKLYDRKPIYTIMVDKYKAREYIAEKIGEQYLVPLLGVWDSPDEIDFDALPDEFVLKCNHDNGVIICRDKKQLDIEKTKKELAFRLSRDYYRKLREWPYKNVPRKIICEKLMKNINGDELFDYKLFCFNGKVKLIEVNSERFSGVCKEDHFDINWNHFNVTGKPSSEKELKKPEFLNTMIEIAENCSHSVPFLRVDFNHWNNQLYMGEFTLFYGGAMKLFEEPWETKLGEWIELPKKYRR